MTDQSITLLVEHRDIYGIDCARITCSCGWNSPWFSERHTSQPQLAATAAAHVRRTHPTEAMHGQ